MTKKPFGVGHRENELLVLIHSDVCGPLSVKIYNNEDYFVTFIDGYSRYAYVYLISHKIEVLSCSRKNKAEVEKKLGRSINVLRSDRGGEYNSKEFESYCQEHGVKRHITMCDRSDGG